MNHEIAFNTIVQNRISSYPENKTLKLIERYKNENGYKDYYNSLDSMGFEIKFTFLIKPLENGNYLPCIKFYPENEFGEIARTISLIDKESSFESLSKCSKYLAKEYLYRLMQFQNLNEILESE